VQLWFYSVGVQMPRFLLLAGAIGLALSATSPARASSIYSFSFSGVVELALATSVAGPPKLEGRLIGDPFVAHFSFEQGSTGTIGSGSLAIDLSAVSGHLYGNQGTSGKDYFGRSLLLSDSSGDFLGSVGSFSFVFVDGSPFRDVLTAQIPFHSIDRADDSGTLKLILDAKTASFSVSAVPLPPALPMFASALLALGVFACLRRKADRTAPCRPSASLPG